MWEAEFNSDAFLPYLPEDEQANPGAYGFELALWLSKELPLRGVFTSYPLGEDWGWLIAQCDGVRETVVGCSSLAGPGEGYANQAIRWRVFVRPARVRSFFRRQAAQHNSSSVASAIEGVLSNAGISYVVTSPSTDLPGMK
jgi:hypothetical protein